MKITQFCVAHINYFPLRIGHENFELINHDVVEPLLIEGEYIMINNISLIIHYYDSLIITIRVINYLL